MIKKTYKHPPTIDVGMSRLTATMGEYSSIFLIQTDLDNAYPQIALKDGFTKLFLMLNTSAGLMLLDSLPQGLTDAMAYLALNVSKIFLPIFQNCAVIADDNLLFAGTIEKAIRVFATYLHCCSENKVFLSAKKLRIFPDEVQFAGRKINTKLRTMTLNPKQFNGIVNATLPTRADALYSFICKMNYMNNSIPHLAAKLATLRELFFRDGS